MKQIRKKFETLGFKTRGSDSEWSVMVPMTASMLRALQWRDKDEEGISVDALRIKWWAKEFIIQEYAWDPIMGWVPGCYYLGDKEKIISRLLKILRDFQKDPFWFGGKNETKEKDIVRCFSFFGGVKNEVVVSWRRK